MGTSERVIVCTSRDGRTTVEVPDTKAERHRVAILERAGYRTSKKAGSAKPAAEAEAKSDTGSVSDDNRGKSLAPNSGSKPPAKPEPNIIEIPGGTLRVTPGEGDSVTVRWVGEQGGHVDIDKAGTDKLKQLCEAMKLESGEDEAMRKLIIDYALNPPDPDTEEEETQ